MKHEYGSYCVPTPIIKDGESVVEDVAGELTCTHTLLGSLIDQIESLGGMARKMEEKPDAFCADAWKSRIEPMWALAEAISARVKDSIILLYAEVERDNATVSIDRQQR